MLFLPGWGFDARLVDLYRLFRDNCLILPNSFVDPACFSAELSAFLQSRHITKIVIVGWSMGAQLGLDFSLTHGHLVGRLDLVAMRSCWPQQEIAAVRRAIAADLPGYLRDFYRKCFLGYKKPYHDFVRELQEDYLQKLPREILMTGLDYLQNFTLPAHIPDGLAVHMIHGRKDLVAPVEEMPQFLGATHEVFPRAGHMVLLDLQQKLQND
ncbi:MAG: alpha/beta hydrolase [Proteobacteria bacterium]|nr:alpha/beta hydrolase [Pseudomonadota bacterium]MBU4297354.1 alpha/beta hydrolase [Pseudomonadota bacterium]MCG2748947.1 alpha/beta hydrolase [Desulfobulbaceae bacterium]